MKARAAKDLVQLSDPAFFRSVSEGLSLVLENATRLEEAALALRDAKHAQGTNALTLFAQEEAAKFLILIDAVRCLHTLAEVRARQLGYFHDHLARGIYAQLSCARPVNLAELERYANDARKRLYLDGPNDVDWIFRNEILAKREGAIYVDYVETVDGHEWQAPRNDDIFLHLYMTPPVLTISQALHKSGMATPDGLAVVAKVWRHVDVRPDLQWDEVEAKNQETLDELERNGVLNPHCMDVYSKIVCRWPFPLYTLDLSPVEVDRKELEQVRANSWPDY